MESCVSEEPCECGNKQLHEKKAVHVNGLQHLIDTTNKTESTQDGTLCCPQIEYFVKTAKFLSFKFSII